MARFHAMIGYAQTAETAPGVHEEVITERNYFGEVIRNIRTWQPGQNLNDDLRLDNRFSVVADDFAYDNLQTMRYIKWRGSLWKIVNIEDQRPRLILTIGGVYNGPTN